jgi:hypothetical protein
MLPTQRDGRKKAVKIIQLSRHGTMYVHTHISAYVKRGKCYKIIKQPVTHFLGFKIYCKYCNWCPAGSPNAGLPNDVLPNDVSPKQYRHDDLPKCCFAKSPVP